MDYDKCSYREYLEILKTEFGDFLRFAEMGKTIRHAVLKARKKSIHIRSLLKKFREISIENDKKITNIMSEAKKEIDGID